MKVKIIKADFAEELERRVNEWLAEEPRDIERYVRHTSYLRTTEGLLAIIEYNDMPIPFTVAKQINKE